MEKTNEDTGEDICIGFIDSTTRKEVYKDKQIGR